MICCYHRFSLRCPFRSAVFMENINKIPPTGEDLLNLFFQEPEDLLEEDWVNLEFVVEHLFPPAADRSNFSSEDVLTHPPSRVVRTIAGYDDHMVSNASVALAMVTWDNRRTRNMRQHELLKQGKSKEDIAEELNGDACQSLCTQPKNGQVQCGGCKRNGLRKMENNIKTVTNYRLTKAVVTTSSQGKKSYRFPLEEEVLLRLQARHKKKCEAINKKRVQEDKKRKRAPDMPDSGRVLKFSRGMNEALNMHNRPDVKTSGTAVAKSERAITKPSGSSHSLAGSQGSGRRSQTGSSRSSSSKNSAGWKKDKQFPQGKITSSHSSIYSRHSSSSRSS